MFSVSAPTSNPHNNGIFAYQMQGRLAARTCLAEHGQNPAQVSQVCVLCGAHCSLGRAQ